jgi:hypothetical protein
LAYPLAVIARRTDLGFTRDRQLKHAQVGQARLACAEAISASHEQVKRDCFASLAMTMDSVIARSPKGDEAISVGSPAGRDCFGALSRASQ